MASQERAQHVSPDRDSFIDTIIIPAGVSASVVSAFEEVDRAQFMYRESRSKAYIDAIVDLSPEATVSQPSLVAQMMDLLQLEGREKVLEVGTATGYQAALLSRLADHVDTIEINPRLVYWAKSNLKRLHYDNVTVHRGDGARGVKERAPFDAIIVTAGLRGVPQILIDQLSVGGRLVAPIGELPEDGRLMLLTKLSESEIQQKDYGWCSFVPFYSSEIGGWTAESLGEIREKRKQEWEEQQTARRDRLKEIIIQNGGEEEYREFIRAIGRPAATIVDKSLSETQILDLFDFFSSAFERGKEAEEGKSETVAGIEANQTDVLPEAIEN